MEDSEPENPDKDIHMQSLESPVADAGGETEDSEKGLNIAEILAKRVAQTKMKNEPSKTAAEDVTEPSEKTSSKEADDSSDQNATPGDDQTTDDSVDEEVPMYESDPDDRVYHNRKSEVFKNLRKMYIVDERVIRKPDFEANNMIGFQESGSLMHALEYAKPYYVDWIVEFYVNLKPSTGNRLSSDFGKVRFRNNTMVVTLKLINKFLRTRPMVEEMVDNINEVFAVLTGGNYIVWTLQFSCCKFDFLIFSYAQVEVTNLLPSKKLHDPYQRTCFSIIQNSPSE